MVASARAAGIVRIVTVGTDLESSRWSVRCADEHDGVYAAVAIHPNETQAVSAEVGAGAPAPGSPAAAEVLAEIEALARSPRVVAVGETGLDYYRHHAEPDVQRWWFREHITIAKRTGKALMIHDREAHADVLRILAEEGPPDRVVFHCFSGDVAMAKQCAEAGYVMSFAGNVTFANAQPLRDAAAAAPAGAHPGRDRRAVPHPGPQPRQAQRARPDRRHPALPGRGQGPGPGRPVRHGHRHRPAHLRPLVAPVPGHPGSQLCSGPPSGSRPASPCGARSGTASSRISSPPMRGLDIRNPCRRLAGHISNHTSPARTGRRSAVGHRVSKLPLSGVWRHTIADAVTGAASEASRPW